MGRHTINISKKLYSGLLIGAKLRKTTVSITIADLIMSIGILQNKKDERIYTTIDISPICLKLINEYKKQGYSLSELLEIAINK